MPLRGRMVVTLMRVDQAQDCDIRPAQLCWAGRPILPVDRIAKKWETRQQYRKFFNVKVTESNLSYRIDMLFLQISLNPAWRNLSFDPVYTMLK